MRVLFIAYYFPPLGGAGVQRSVKFVKYLPAFGVEPVVLTGSGTEFDRLCPPDPSLSADIPSQVRVLRTAPISRAVNGGRLGDGMRRFVGLPSWKMQAWNSSALSVANEYLNRESVDAIYVSASPYSALLLANELSKIHSIPWVADLRDPWALDEFQVYKTGWHRALEIRKMGDYLRTASAIIMNTPEAAQCFRNTFPQLSGARVSSITNGYDEEDFDKPVKASPDKRFTIAHSGSFHADSGLRQRKRAVEFGILGRSVPGVEFLPRSHFYLLRALELWRKEQPGIARDVRMVCAGNATASDRALVEQSGVREIVEFRGYLSHAEGVRLIRDADLLFLPLHKLPPGRRCTIVPGKTYEYLATSRPILAAVPEGDARDFLTKAGTGLVCEPDDVNGMVRILKNQFQAWQAGNQAVTWNSDFVVQFERRELTQRLAAEMQLVSDKRQGRALNTTGCRV